MARTRYLPLLLFALLALTSLPATAGADCDLGAYADGTEIARLELTVGTVCFELLRDDAPGHVENFLWYLDNHQLDGTFFHRYATGFVFQGASFRLGKGDYESVPARTVDDDPKNPPVVVFNEPCTVDPKTQACPERGNETGTVALAKLGGQPNSGTTGWFINLTDNHFLDPPSNNGGFTVFARVTPDTMPVVEAIASLPAATPDDNYWLTAALKNSSVWEPRLSQPPNYDLPGFGCFDPTQVSAITDPANRDLGLDDPSTGSFPWMVSSECGTPEEREGFVPNPGDKACPDEDHLAVGVTGPASLSFTTEPPSYFRITCEQEFESTTQRELWRVAFQSEFDTKLIYIQSAQHIIVPEPTATLLTACTLTCLATLHHKRHHKRHHQRRP